MLILQCDDYAQFAIFKFHIIDITDFNYCIIISGFSYFKCRSLNALHLFISDFLISYFAISALRFTAVSFCLSSQTENLNRRIQNFDCFIFTFSQNFKTYKKYRTYKNFNTFQTSMNKIWVLYFSMKEVQKSPLPKNCNQI